MFYLIQFTWGLLENIVALIIYLIFINKPHYKYKNAFVTSIGSNFNGNFSIGCFIFISEDKKWFDDSYDLRHEYGHCLQNLYFGPLSPFIFKIPSCIHFWICKLRNDFDHYYDFYPEAYANKLGGND